MELYVIRHGQSVNNALPDDQPRIQDAPLTDLGREQARRLAAYFSDPANRDPVFSPETGYSRFEAADSFGITHLYTSPMHRALQTAAPLGAAIGLRPEIWIDIHEHGGVYQQTPDGVVGFPGRTRQQIAEEFPNFVLPDRITDDGWWNASAGNESYAAAASRAVQIAGELRRRARPGASEPAAPPERIMLISHGTFIDALLKALLGQLPRRDHFFLMYNTGVTRIDFDENERLLLRYINRMSHLPASLIS